MGIRSGMVMREYRFRYVRDREGSGERAIKAEKRDKNKENRKGT
jgi:hypothetical protein